MGKEYTNCNLCGSNNYRLLFVKEESDCSVVRCNECGFVYINPRVSKSELIEAVEGDFYAQYYTPSAFDPQENYRKHRNFLGKLRNYYVNGHLLDVGCAGGLFLTAARQEGWQVKGVEISRLGVDYGRNKLDLDIFWGELEEANYEIEYFDVVTCMGVIEHVQNPQGLLKEVNRILRKGGLLFISMPNFSALTRLLLGVQWSAIIAEHLHYFTVETARQMLIKNGFRVRKVVTEHTDPLEILVRGIFRRRISQEEQAETKRALKNKIDSIKCLTLLKGGVNLLLLNPLRLGDTLVVYAEK